ncbi:MAG: ATP-binding cassette domain-containing protein [Pseudoclavibacter sp.]|nr:ATP-binding cassette domain-containing protein [Pseudoclavibacter sp.]
MSAPTTTTAPGVRCHKLAVRYPRARQWRPDGASWSAPPGSRTLLLGPSGCGKSTLALALTGLVPEVRPARVRGELCIDGVPLPAMPAVRLRETVAIVFQDPDAQLFTETVFDELCFAGENRLLPARRIEAAAERALDAMRLREYRDADPRTLSGGQRQRVAIAAEPRLLVLDEPTANLDPVSRAELYRVLAQAPGAQDRAVVLIEHNVDDALGFVDRVVALDGRGRLLAQGPAREVLSRHAEELAAAGVWLPTGVRMRRALAGCAAAARLPERAPLHPQELAADLAALHAAGLRPEPAAPSRTERSAGAAEGAERTGASGAAGVAEPAGPAGAPPAVLVRGLTVRRGPRRRRRTVLRDVGLTAPAGSFTALVGVNGAGKSTLLHAIAGLIRPEAGEVLVHGRRVRRRGPAPVGLVFQNPEHQFVETSVREELLGGADPALDAAGREERCAELLERFRLAEAAERHPSTLSGGQQRRLSVATALMGGHRVIAFDEPTFGQDAEGAAAMAQLLVRLHRDGVTVLVVTHDLQLVAEHASHVAVLRDGAVTAAGTAGEVFASQALPEAGLRLPPLCEAARGLPEGSSLRGLRRLRELERLRPGRGA